jgi:hypothetical protein
MSASTPTNQRKVAACCTPHSRCLATSTSSRRASNLTAARPEFHAATSALRTERRYMTVGAHDFRSDAGGSQTPSEAQRRAGTRSATSGSTTITGSTRPSPWGGVEDSGVGREGGRESFQRVHRRAERRGAGGRGRCRLVWVRRRCATQLMATDGLATEGREATLLVTIDYGEKNVFGVAMMNELADEIRDAAAEPELRFGRLRSRGNVFCLRREGRTPGAPRPPARGSGGRRCDRRAKRTASDDSARRRCRGPG